MNKRLLISSALIVALSGCAATHEKTAAADIKFSTAPATNTQRWWLAFNDPLMDSLADELVAQNIDIKIATTRVTEARAIAQQTRARLFPELALSGSTTRSNTNPGTTGPATISRGGFDAAWEVDLFGGLRADTDAATARAIAAGENVNDIRNSVVADLMRAIIEWRQATQTLQTTNALLAAQDHQIHLFSVRAEAGLIDTSFVTRARAEREQTATQIPLATAAAFAAQYQIERLLGKPSNALADELRNVREQQVSIPESKTVLDTSIDAMRARPDIRAAEADLNGARADLASARANLWPKLNLSGFFGVQDVAGGLLVADNPLWSIGAGISAPLFNFGRLHAAVDAADSRSQRAVSTYENTVLAALQETHTALADYLNGLNSLTQQTAALHYRQETVALADERFRLGLTDMTDLTTAQTELNRAAILLIERNSATAIAYIRLQKALATSVMGDDAVASE
ncbi:MAG: Toluene efflux pump outer membrane protein TtgI [Verrucomicrobiaceae bacterium]|nr:Toluene efflux pump outer membrane protein TtgI [Verrucomicrobiaceae bacterium]